MGKGSNTTTTSNSPNPQALAAYSNLLNRAGNVANTPYQAYSGELVAPVNAQQQTGIGGINTNANYAQPFINQAAGYANRAAAPISGNDIQQYLNPFTQDVVRATENQFNQQNAMQQSQLTGNAAAQGALGGDRVGVAQGTLAGQQQLAEAPVIAGLESQGYNTALQTALTEQQNTGNAAYSLGNLGVAGQNAALTGANAQVGAGSLEQQTQQQLDAALYGQFAQGQAFPYQQTQWLAGLDTGVGSQMGGSGTTTGPAPNQTAQFLGLGLAGLSFLNRGGKVRGLDSGGSVGFGGTPYGFETSYIPTMQLTPGKGAPTPPGLPGQGQGQQPTLGQSVKDAQALGGLFKGKGLGSSYGGINYGLGDWGDGLSGSDMASAASAGVDSGLSFDPSNGSVYRRGGVVRRPMVAGFGTGGMVRHYADGGGDASFDDRFNAASQGASFDDRFGAAGDFRPQPQRLEDRLGLGDMALHGDPNALDSTGAPVNPNAMLRANMDSAYPLSGIDPANKSENNFGFDFNPVRTNANRAYGPNASDSDLPPFATTPVPAPPLAPGRDVDDIRTAGLGASPMSDSGEGYSGHALGFAPSPERGGRDSEASQGSGGLGLLSKLGINMTPNLRQALLAAGLGMMASKSPFLGTAIGEGGLQGLAAYSGAEKQEEAKKKTEADIEHGRKQLEQAATIAQKRIEMETKKLSEQAEDRKENRALRVQALEQGKIPPGYRMNNGQMEPIPGGPADPKVKSEAIDPVTLKRTAAQYNLMGGAALTNMGRGAQSGAILQAVRAEAARQDEEAGITPEQRAQIQAEYQGNKAAQRTLGTQEARMGTAAFEAEGAIKLGRDVINKVPRTSFLPLNQLIQGYQRQTLNPEQAELFTRTQGIVNAYAAVMARGANVTTDASRHRAEDLLNTASDPAIYNRVLDTMQSEIDMAKNSPDRMRQFYMQRYGGKAVEGAGGAAPAGGAAAPAASGPVKVTTPAEAQSLAPGTRYVTPDGKVYTR